MHILATPPDRRSERGLAVPPARGRRPPRPYDSTGSDSSAPLGLAQQRTVKEWYSTAELAPILGRAEFTVREWYRLGRVRAEKENPAAGRRAS
ncbi:MAG TPA: hypothetical protein VKA15_04385 [Isosphaeraceae bacterium]|nr:hypothetical protein [Isosphaeraceae bacterium]